MRQRCRVSASSPTLPQPSLAHNREIQRDQPGDETIPRPGISTATSGLTLRGFVYARIYTAPTKWRPNGRPYIDMMRTRGKTHVSHIISKWPQ